MVYREKNGLYTAVVFGVKRGGFVSGWAALTWIAHVKGGKS